MTTYYESVVVQNSNSVVHGVNGALVRSDMPVLYTRIRAISADKITRNYTYYPSSELRGDNESYGYVTFVQPYPVPILREHRQSDSPFVGQAAEPMGRVIEARFVRSKNGNYVEVLAEITDPDAIEMIVSRRYLTVSIGHIPMGVRCSICGNSPDHEDCGHTRGQVYETANGEKKMCYYEMLKPRMIELSFVNVPSDNQAQVLDVDRESASMEHFVMRDGKYYSLSQWKFVESVWSNEEEMMAESEDIRVLNMGILYRLEQNDPLYSQESDIVQIGEDLYTLDEAKLTAAQRKRLPDSAFCGPNRSFPAHDRAHVIAGLRLLGRAKLSTAQKARVRACLLRKARQLGMSTGDNKDSASPVLFITETDIFEMPGLLTAPIIRHLVQTLEMDDFTLSCLRSASVGLLDKESDIELFESRNPSVLAESVAYPVVIAVSQEYYDAFTKEFFAPSVVETELAEAEDTPEHVSESPVLEREDTVTPKPDMENTSELEAKDENSVSVSVEEEIERLVGKRMSVEALVDYYEGLLDSIRCEYDSLYEIYHELLVDYAAFVGTLKSYPALRGKSHSEAVEAFRNRPDSFLKMLIEDLRDSSTSAELVVITDAQDPRIPETRKPGEILSESSSETDQEVTGASDEVNDFGVPKGETVSSLGQKMVVSDEEEDTILLLQLLR